MKYYLAFWCHEGFELIQDVSHEHPDVVEQAKLMDILSGGEGKTSNEFSRLLNILESRGRFNPERDYEAYIFLVDDDISRDEVVSISNDNPQFLVDFIRKNGTKIFSFKRERIKQKIV